MRKLWSGESDRFHQELPFSNDMRRLHHLVVLGVGETGREPVSRNDRNEEPECRYFRQKI
jgi:hypothetical protein